MLRYRHTSLRWQAALFSVVLLAALVMAGLHRATVRHGYCTKHGALVDLPANAEAVEPTVTPDRFTEPHTLVAAHGCAALRLLQTPLRRPAESTLLRRAQGTPGRWTPPCAPILPAGAPLYLAAPKHSPPASV